MYQVIIVDDEPRILEGIIHLFPWNNFGFEVVASFTNGKEALEYINAHPQVDVASGKPWTNVRRAIICLTKSMQTRQIMWRL